MDDVADIILENPEDTPSIFGRVVQSGDVNNDNYDDLIVNALHYDSKRGRAYLYYGGDTFDIKIDKIFKGENKGDQLGRQTAIGDVDGDGCDDILFGTRDYHTSNGKGRTYLYYGAPDASMNTICDVTFTGEAVGDNFGSGVDISDIDGDGAGDILIGARYWNRGQGRVSIYWGGTRNLDPDNADLHLYGEAAIHSHLGGDRISCGYFNADDYLDVLTGGFRTGRAYIFYGDQRGSMDNVCDKKFIGNKDDTDGGLYGLEVIAVDVNGDRYHEAVIADVRLTRASDRGRVYLYYGPFSDKADITFNWNTTNASPGKHILKASIAPVAGEEDAADNSVTVTVDVKEKRK